MEETNKTSRQIAKEFAKFLESEGIENEKIGQQLLQLEKYRHAVANELKTAIKERIDGMIIF